MSEEQKNFRRDIETLKTIEILEQKSTIAEIKNSLDENSSRQGTAIRKGVTNLKTGQQKLSNQSTERKA